MSSYLIFLFFLIPFFTYWVSKKVSFFDNPVGNLKIHKKSIPYSGGILSVLASLLFLFIFGFNLPVLIFLLIAILGILDDLYDLSILFRLISEFLLVSLLVNYYITFDNFILSSLLVFTGVIFINAVNFIDIKDGLVTAYAISSISALVNFNNNLDPNLVLFSTLFTFSLISFYWLNSQPAKTYQGDGGAYSLALIIFSFSLSFLNFVPQSLNSISNIDDWTKVPLFSHFVVSISFLIIYMPVIFEFIFVVLIRLKKGKNPLMGSNDHIAIRLINRDKSTFYISALFSFPAIISLIYSTAYYGSINIFSLINIVLLFITFSIKYLIF